LGDFVVSACTSIALGMKVGMFAPSVSPALVLINRPQQFAETGTEIRRGDVEKGAWAYGEES